MVAISQLQPALSPSQQQHQLTQMAHAIRFLAIDAVQQANSGHPGMPMGMAEIAVALWAQHLSHNPRNPHWINRDRFVLSNGHGSMLLYALLHLTGYDLSIEDLKQFRQLHSKTPGHPEFGITAGVETTTGPLGQGLANAVGMALAEQLLANAFNRPDFAVIDHYTYAFVGDGCLMEGISHEVASLAGTLKLSKLIVLYDDNGISIDGRVSHWFADDTPRRFEAYGWRVIPNVDGHDVAAVSAAIALAKKSSQHSTQPVLICCKTAIGQGSPNLADTDKVHGAPLGAAEIAATRAALNWSYAPFEIPAEIAGAWDHTLEGVAQEAAWNVLFSAYQAAHPELAAELQRRMAGTLPDIWATVAQASLQQANDKAATVATRKASQLAIEALAPVLPEFLGGSADLTGSNFTDWSTAKAVRAATTDVPMTGNHINYGVREFGMSAMMNGIALHGGYIPFGGTFLTFTDYSRNAIRMAALMRIRSIFVGTHDSIGLGEDGPTHQSVEHVASLRLIPNLFVWRPCDTVESTAAWIDAVERHNAPSVLIFSRQNVAFQARNADTIANIRRGGYVLHGVPAQFGAIAPQVILIATGSEVPLAVEAQALLAQEQIAATVVSMPCTRLFDQQSADYQASVLPRGVPRVAIEAGVTDFWRKYVGLEGAVVGLDTFGESAPAPVLFKHFEITAAKMAVEAKRIIQN
jgi:transketolase